MALRSNFSGGFSLSLEHFFLFPFYPWFPSFPLNFFICELSGMHSGHTSLDRACKSTSYCYPGSSQLPSVKSILYRHDIHEDLLPPDVRSFLQLVFLYNMRVSELLGCLLSDVLHPDRVLCKGKKKSHSYIIFVPGLSASLHDIDPASNDFLLFPFSYLYVYRWALRAGIGYLFNSRSNQSVLHTGRFTVAAKCAGKFSDSVCSDVLRHRSASSLKFYLPSKVVLDGKNS